jgi:hypothetical protein
MINNPLAMAWYTPASWRQLQEAVGAGDDSYEEFVRRVDEQIRLFAARGIVVEKMLIDVPHMLAWCKRHGYGVNDSKGRATYGAMLQMADRDLAELDRMDFEDGSKECMQ